MTPLHALGICLGLALAYGGVRFARRGDVDLFPVLVWLSFGATILVATVLDLLAAGGPAAALDSLLGDLAPGERRLAFLFLVGALAFAVLHLYGAVRAGSRRIAQLHQEIALLRHEVERLRDEESPSDPREPRERLDDD